MITYDIVLASYNGEKYLREQIESLITCVEKSKIGRIGKLVISDDNSQDSTTKILNDYKIKYPYIYICNNEYKRGVKGNFQNGLNMTTNDYVFLSDQDDVWISDKIEKSLHYMIKIESLNQELPVLILSNLNYVDEELQYLGSGHDFLENDPESPILTSYRSFGQGCTMLLNRKLIEKSTPVPNEAVMHDWWFLLVASNFGKVKYIKSPLMNYRQHNDNVCGGYKNNKINRFFDIAKQRNYINQVSKQSKLFLDKFNLEISDEPKKVHVFLSDIHNRNLLERLSFFKKIFPDVRGSKNKFKLLVQLIVA